MKGDAAALVGHFVVGCLIIFVIECDICGCFGKISCRSVPAENEDLELDEDVIAEIERVARQGGGVYDEQDLESLLDGER